MTKPVLYSSKSKFSEWLRNQPKIDSSLGFIASDIDYVWKNYKTGLWVYIEEKCHMENIGFPQSEILDFTHELAEKSRDKKYRGFHFIQFEYTNPDDGKIYLDHKEITKKDLIEFLCFEKPSNWYKTMQIGGIRPESLDDEERKEFENLVIRVFRNRNISLAGVKIEFNKEIDNNGNGNFIPADIYENDNFSSYAIGNRKIVFIFDIETLKILKEENVPLVDAMEYAENIIEFEQENKKE